MFLSSCLLSPSLAVFPELQVRLGREAVRISACDWVAGASRHLHHLFRPKLANPTRE